METARLFRIDDGQPGNTSHISLTWAVSADPGASKKAGRPIFNKVLRGEVLAPSQQKSSPVFDLIRIYDTPEGPFEKRCEPYYTQYEPQIKQFLTTNEGDNVAGTPIEQWPIIDAAFAASLKAMKVFTVEQLRDASDTTKQRIGMGASEWQAKAKNWLAAAADGAVVGRLTSELAQRDAQIADLQRQMQELVARFDAQGERRGPGRPPKQRDEAA